MERADDGFHSRVSEAFTLFATEAWQQSHPECGPIVKADGTNAPEMVHNEIAAILAQNLPDEFSMLHEKRVN
jgi:hypothetical protein